MRSLSAGIGPTDQVFLSCPRKRDQTEPHASLTTVRKKKEVEEGGVESGGGVFDFKSFTEINVNSSLHYYDKM